MSITIGVDIGGSHVTSAAVDLTTSKIISGTCYRGSVNSKASKDLIFKDWAKVINMTLSSVNSNEPIGIGFAMPGPFQYRTGRAMFEKNDKYEALYQVSVVHELRAVISKPSYRHLPIEWNIIWLSHDLSSMPRIFLFIFFILYKSECFLKT